jgi:tetratricopeptide (TPR) repeat protein
VSHSPTSPRIAGADSAYTQAWREVNELLRTGRSFSGHERNCCFLNTGKGQFANVSAISGFDFADDGRGLAITDWDHDGDLDMWVTNRSAPRVRFLENLAPTGNHVAFRLEGKKCNRDAIGARLQLDLGSASDLPLTRTLRAGEGYLSQSSKWIHFGLGPAAEVKKVIVHWPGGEPESFTVDRVNTRYTLVEGSGEASVWTDAPRRLGRVEETSEPPLFKMQTQNLLSQRVPLPTLDYTTFDGRQGDASLPKRNPTLIILWSTTCQPCLRELSELATRKSELMRTRLDVLTLCVDSVQAGSHASKVDAQEIIARLNIPFGSGMVGEPFLRKLQIVHDEVYDHHLPLPVPTSFLVDTEGKLAALYQGAVSVERLIDDVTKLALPEDRLLAAALPQPGRWIARPGPHRLPRVAETLLEEGFTEDAIRFAARLDKESDGNAQQSIIRNQFGKRLLDETNVAAAIHQFQEAIRLDPQNAVAHMNLGTEYGRRNELPQAVFHLSEAVRLSGDQLPDAHLNLGVALRRMGRFEEATQSLKRALEIDAQLAPAHVNLAIVHGRQGRIEDAIKHFRLAAELDPQDTQTRINLGIALMKQDKKEEALSALEHVLQSQPDLPVALTYASELLAELGRLDEAMDMLRASVQRKPLVAPLRMLLARYCEQSGDQAEALQQYLEGERLERGNPIALTRIAWIRSTSPSAELRDGAAAVRLAQRAVMATKRKDTDALNALAAAFAETGDFARAVSTTEEAIDLLRQTTETDLLAKTKQYLQIYRLGQPNRSPPLGKHEP